MYGYEAVEEKKNKKDLLQNWNANNFIKGSCVETPLYTMCWINEDGDKGQVREQGEELGGGEGQIRGAKG